jgi:hypothetical protein
MSRNLSKLAASFPHQPVSCRLKSCRILLAWRRGGGESAWRFRVALRGGWRRHIIHFFALGDGLFQAAHQASNAWHQLSRTAAYPRIWRSIATRVLCVSIRRHRHKRWRRRGSSRPAAWRMALAWRASFRGKRRWRASMAAYSTRLKTTASYASLGARHISGASRGGI